MVFSSRQRTSERSNLQRSHRSPKDTSSGVHSCLKLRLGDTNLHIFHGARISATGISCWFHNRLGAHSLFLHLLGTVRHMVGSYWRFDSLGFFEVG
jgi:hypothetical protein